MFMFWYYLIFIFIDLVPVVEVSLEVDGDDASAIDGNVQVPDSPAVLYLVNEQYEERLTDSGVNFCTFFWMFFFSEISVPCSGTGVCFILR